MNVHGIPCIICSRLVLLDPPRPRARHSRDAAHLTRFRSCTVTPPNYAKLSPLGIALSCCGKSHTGLLEFPPHECQYLR